MSDWAYYNEFDKYAAQWLRNLMARGLIAPGFVDDRSIEDIQPNDLLGFKQVHFFAGIGVWSYALRRAGWTDDRAIWTASCPCQPFSQAGQGNGLADERHLWPSVFHLAAVRKPERIVGEQVASPDGAIWLDLVQTDMEALGYAFGACAFPSAGAGAPHIRDRTYWMADADMSNEERFSGIRLSMESKQEADGHSFVNHWATDEVIRCSDGKTRPIKSSVQPLADGSAGRVGRVRADQGHRAGRIKGYGNALNAEAATTFIKSTM